MKTRPAVPWPMKVILVLWLALILYAGLIDPSIIGLSS